MDERLDRISLELPFDWLFFAREQKFKLISNIVLMLKFGYP